MSTKARAYCKNVLTIALVDESGAAYTVVGVAVLKIGSLGATPLLSIAIGGDGGVTRLSINGTTATVEIMEADMLGPGVYDYWLEDTASNQTTVPVTGTLIVQPGLVES